MTTAEHQPEPSLWATVREAVRGSQQDFTKAPIGRAVILLAVPMVLEMLMESVEATAPLSSHQSFFPNDRTTEHLLC